RQVAGHLARRDVVQTPHAGAMRSFEQRLRAEDVRAEEAAGVDHREAVVRLGGEVDDDLDPLLAEQALDKLAVADVPLNEAHVQSVEVARVARVREEVERDDVVVRMPPEPPVDEVRADEAGGAGDKEAA